MDLFDSWNDVKKKVNTYNCKKHHVKEVWWCFWGINIGFEESGTGSSFQRPVLIIRTLSPNTCVVVPLTTSKDVNKNRIDVGLIDNKNAKAIISQVKVIDTRRLSNRITVLENDKYSEIRKAVRNLF